MTYTVKARMEKRWFKPDRLVFDILEHYSEWDDPSYGNGGGDFVDKIRVVTTVTCPYTANQHIQYLEQYDGKPK